jgi:hypothetical protein
MKRTANRAIKEIKSTLPKSRQTPVFPVHDIPIMGFPESSAGQFVAALDRTAAEVFFCWSPPNGIFVATTH